jgi:hypothetical protein
MITVNICYETGFLKDSRRDRCFPRDRSALEDCYKIYTIHVANYDDLARQLKSLITIWEIGYSIRIHTDTRIELTDMYNDYTVFASDLFSRWTSIQHDIKFLDKAHLHLEMDYDRLVPGF